MTVPTSFLWLDTLACGHHQLVDTAVPVDRSNRIGEPAVCWRCRDAGKDSADIITTVTETRWANDDDVAEIEAEGHG